jgi:hypothetical protein
MESNGDLWYLDNGASNYMTGDRQKFRHIYTTIGGKVRFGDGSSVEIHGRGSIFFKVCQVNNGCCVVFISSLN